MRVSIFGTGYVGLVTGACLAEVGHHVVCVDINADRIAALMRGEIPIFEPGLAPMVKSNQAAGGLEFTTDAAYAIAHADIIFIAVGTPAGDDGSADLTYVLAVANTIGLHLERPALIVGKSTVPVGTGDKVRAAVASAMAARNADVAFEVISNPEFLKEGDAVNDCMRPDRIIVGAGNPAAIETMKRLYAPFNRNHDRMVVMDVRSAELTKYAANAMLATKISFMNEIANIAERVGADIENVRKGIGSDPRIGRHFIYAGAGYGGSCFPKDVQALARTAGQAGYDAQLLHAVEAVNARQKEHLFELIERHYRDGQGAGSGSPLRGKTFAVWGLAFKPDTDDMREASSLRLLDQLWDSGASVRAYDPEATGEAARIYGERDGLVLCRSASSALEGADALVVVTEWKQFRSPDFARLKSSLRDAVIFDGRNVYEPAEVEAAGIAYWGVGRGRSIASSKDVLPER